MKMKENVEGNFENKLSSSGTYGNKRNHIPGIDENASLLLTVYMSKDHSKFLH